MCLAIPGEVLRVERRDGLLEAEVRFGGVRRRICVECTPEVKPGDYVLAHAGFALQQLDESEAQLTLAALREVGRLRGAGEAQQSDEAS